MKYLFAILGRSTLIALMSTALICTSSFAGFSTGGIYCGAECCKPAGHHTEHAAKTRITSAKSMNCCGGFAGEPCDLQSSSNVRRQNTIQAIQSVCPTAAIVAYQWQASKIYNVHLSINTFPQQLVFPETTPIYIEFQSILI